MTRLMQTVLALALGAAIALSPLCALLAQPRDTVMTAGPYAVGYRDLVLRDASRSTLPVDDAPTVRRAGRVIHVALWYPAIRNTGTLMTRGDYVARVALGRGLSLDSSVRRTSVNEYVARARDLGGDTAVLRRALPALLATATTARQDARAASGRFPVVLFPEWQPPAVNNMLAEYFAGHGYVVASVATKGTFEEQVEYWSPRGIETMVDDLRYALNALDTLRFVDVERVAAMGVGIAASGALALQMRTPSVRAVISLEGGITTEGELRLIRRTPYFDVARVTVPMLAITAPHPSVDAARLEFYRYANRQLVHFPRSGEFWFLDYGVLDESIPGIIGQNPGDAALSYRWAARMTREFLDLHLSARTQSSNWLGTDRAPHGAPLGLFTVRYRPALPAPPSASALKAMMGQGGVDRIRQHIATIRVDSQPITTDAFLELDRWLANGNRDPQGAARHQLALMRATMYPESARAQFTAGMSALRAADSTSARRFLEQALRALPADMDAEIDQTLRVRMEQQANSALTRLR